MTTTGKDRIMIYGPKTDGTYVVEFRVVSDLNTEDRDCGDPAFSGTNALRIIRAGCERYLIKEVGRPC